MVSRQLVAATLDLIPGTPIREAYTFSPSAADLVIPVYIAATDDSLYTFNALTIELVKATSHRIPLEADTPTYGDVNLNDTRVGLAPGVERVTLRGFNNTTELIGCDVSTRSSTSPNDVRNSPIPSSVRGTGERWTNEAPTGLYQAYFTVDEGLQTWRDLGVEFGEINIAGGLQAPNAYTFTSSTTTNAAIVFGRRNGIPLSIRDVTHHELGHVFLNGFLDYTGDGGALHEGIADIIGTYVESERQGTIDWVIGDDEPNIGNWVARDLSNPKADRDSWSGIQSLPDNERHMRGQLIGNYKPTDRNDDRK